MAADIPNGPTEPNEALAEHLVHLSWSGERLVREIRRVLGADVVHATAPYKWLKGHQPRRNDVRHAVAFVLSQASGQPVTVRDLWPGCVAAESQLVPATTGMEVAWTIDGTLSIVDDWLVWGLMDRRVFMAMGGSALTSLVWAAVHIEPARLVAALRGGQVDATLVEQVEQTIPELSRLDDREGGGDANLVYVNAQFQVVGQLLKRARHAGKITRRLLVALAELGYLAGWMAADAERDGLAQRYYCATRRSDVYPAQRGEIGGGISGSNGLPGSRKRKGTIACQETSGRAQAYGARRWGIRVIRPRLDCRNPNLQKVRVDARRKDA